MEIVYNDQDLTAYIGRAVTVSNDAPVLLDRFLAHATEVDVDAVCDGREVLIGGIMEHIEEAGVHSGDSACCLPPHQLSAAVQGALRRQTERLAMALGVVGLINIQFAIQGEEVFVLEVNPRASRTVPFVSKATGLPLARLAAECMMGRPLADQGVRERVPGYWSVKEAVFPFIKLPGVDTLLGPEMKSTGEVMGVGVTFGEAFAKAQLAAGMELPAAGRVFISVRDADKEEAQVLARALVRLGFEVTATRGTAKALCAADVPCQVVNKVLEGRPHIVDLIKNDAITLIINTTEGRQAIKDSVTIRTSALERRVAYTTTMAGAMAILAAIPRARAGSGQPPARPSRGARHVSKTPMTQSGAQKLRDELQRLKNDVRPRIIRAIAEARAHGDLSENAEYHAAREQQGFVEARIADIEGKLSHAEVIDIAAVNARGKVVFGATVELMNVDTEEVAVYQIVGEDEADIKSGLVSIRSPIARALITKEAGEIIVVEAPGGRLEYEIIDVRYV